MVRILASRTAKLRSRGRPATSTWPSVIGKSEGQIWRGNITDFGTFRGFCGGVDPEIPPFRLQVGAPPQLEDR